MALCDRGLGRFEFEKKGGAPTIRSELFAIGQAGSGVASGQFTLGSSNRKR